MCASNAETRLEDVTQPLGLFTNRRHVARTQELARVEALPRRTWTEPELADLARKMTNALKTPRGTMTLHTIQALALHDLALEEGLFAMVGVGRGKTLIAFLAAYILKSYRALLLLPASLVNKAHAERDKLGAHWLVDTGVRIASYQEMGRVGGANLLETWTPDLIIADEGQKLKNPRAGVTLRVARYMAEHPKTRFVAMSGTFMGSQADIRDYAHILEWCLKERSPITREHGELEEWADALGEASRVNPMQRVGPGALLNFATEEERRTLDPVTAARRGYRRRLTETRGIVATSDDDVTCSLIIEPLEYKVSQVTEDNFAKLRDTATTPDDWDLMEAIEVWACARQLALGMHMIWDPRPPPEWRAARKAWKSYVREVIKNSQRGHYPLDTEEQVAIACGKGQIPREEFDAWKEIEPTYKIRVRDVWHDDSALRACEAWIKKHPKAGVVWTEHTFFAEELARRAGIPYFGAEGKDRYGNELNTLAGDGSDHSLGPTIIASIAANATGRNLQHRWRHNLITTNLGAMAAEQLLGRTHRYGQRADEVTVDVLFACWEHANGWAQAMAGARAAADMTGGSQKLLLADVTIPGPDDLGARRGKRWAK